MPRVGSSNNINRSRDNAVHQGLSLLQSMLYHSQEITTHYWLTPFLYFIHKHAHTVRGGGGEIERYYGFLCHLDNQLLGEVTDASLVVRSRRFMDDPWRTASVKISASLRVVREVTSLGLKIIALPAARAGADFHRAIWIG